MCTSKLAASVYPLLQFVHLYGLSLLCWRLWDYKKNVKKKFYNTVLSILPQRQQQTIHARRNKFFPTCKFDNCVKDFSQPGWVHLYGRSPVWILNENTNTSLVHDERTWPQKDTEADEKPKTVESFTCCAAEGDWAVWSSFGSRSRYRVSLQCGCGHVGPSS